MNKKDEALDEAIRVARIAIMEWKKLVSDLDRKAWKKIDKCEDTLYDLRRG